MTQNKKIVLVQITSGQGPNECALAVCKVFERLSKQAKRYGITTEILSSVPARKVGIYDSMLLSMSGRKVNDFIKSWLGTIQWICESPYRPRYKRKNWFVGVHLLPVISVVNLDVKAEDMTWKAVKASGPGGQHVNKTDSAVQAMHHPSGIQVTCSEGRSQHANKKRAFEKISALLLSRMKDKKKKQVHKQWKTHKELERGNPVKVFVGKEFRER